MGRVLSDAVTGSAATKGLLASGGILGMGELRRGAHRGGGNKDG
jgi:hypothetical protein